MARTLGCLVASMTLGAVLLDWVQPSHRSDGRPAIELIARGGAIQPWASVRVAPRAAVQATQVKDTHFVIDREGNCSATDHWLNQRRLGQEPVVRIGLLLNGHSNEVTSTQWLATQELVGALQRACAIVPRQIVIDDTLAVPPPIASAARSHP